MKVICSDKRIRALFPLLIVSVYGAGCGLVAPGIKVSGRVTAPVHEYEDEIETHSFFPVIHEITPELLLQQKRNSRPINKSTAIKRANLGSTYDYRIGRGDVLTVVVWNHPELSNPMGTTTGAEGIGRLVRQDGTIFFPFAGTVEAAGRNTEEIRQEITERLAPFIERPQVDVRVVTFRSQKIYVTGEINNPGTLYLDDRPFTILDAISRSNGFTPDADQRFVHLTREGDSKRIDLMALYSVGAENELLRDGDIIHVREDDFNQVFVLGEVSSQTIVPMRRGRLTLAEAISAAEGLRIGTADTRRIVVIRGEPIYREDGVFEGMRPVIYQLDGRQAAALLLAEGFSLEPRDIVFIPASAIVRWNRVMDQILPTIQTLWMTDRIIRG